MAIIPYRAFLPPRRSTVGAAAPASYADALARVAALRERDAAEALHPNAHLRLLTHGRRTERAIVFLHGITSSPPQFFELGELFHARGYNVLIPRMPHHGLRDRMGPALGRFTGRDLVQYTCEALDAAAGLGQHVTLAGLSVGGVAVAWAAQYRADVHQAVLIAPSFAPYGLPMPLVEPLARVVRRLPNRFFYWHPVERGGYGPPHVYPRFSTHALAETFLLGRRYTGKRRRVSRRRPAPSSPSPTARTRRSTTAPPRRC